MTAAAPSTAALDAAWDSLTWWDQEDLAEDLGLPLEILDGETGAPRPAWATAQVLETADVEIVEPAPASTPSDVPFPTVSALYVDRRGPYAKLVGETYDVERDARTFEGGGPVVAHPPCGPWGRLAWRCNQDPETARHAVAMVRRHGGVLEHPNGSRLFRELGIPVGDWSNPERETDAWGGYTIKVDQIDLGHRAIKSTILYVVGTTEIPVALAARQEGATPHPVQRMGKVERRLTPEALAWNLAALAARCVPPVQPGLEPEPTPEAAEASTTEAAEASTETDTMTDTTTEAAEAQDFPAVDGAGEAYSRHGVLVPECAACNGYGFEDGKPANFMTDGRRPSCPACYGSGEDLGHLALRHTGRTFEDLVVAEDEDVELRVESSSSQDPLELRERRALADLIRQAQANLSG